MNGEIRTPSVYGDDISPQIDVSTAITMRQISIRSAPREFKVALVEAMGYKVEGDQILLPTGEKYLDPYTDVPVKLGNMLVVPGSTIVLDDNALSIAAYDEEHPGIL